MNIEKYLKSYLWVLRVDKRISVNTYKSYEYDFKVFLDWMKLNKLKITDDIILKFYDYLKNDKKNLNSSITRKMNLLSNFFKYCNEEHKTNLIVPEKQNKKLEKAYRIFMEEADLIKIREFLNKNLDNKSYLRMNCVVEILYSTGLRVSELLKLKKIDISEIKKNRSLKIVGKGEVMRTVFFSDIAINAIDNYVLNVKLKNELLFPITRQRIFQLLKNLAETLDIPMEKIFPHSLRHRLLTDLVQKGMNLVNVQKIAGHKQISTTERYTHVEDYLYEEIYKYHPLVKKFS